MIFILEFLRYLRFIKIKAVESPKTVFTLYSLSFVGLAVLGYLVDYYLTWNYFYNVLRCLIALGIGVVLFSSLYSLSIFYQKDESVITRLGLYLKSLSYKQRINLSMIIVFVSIIVFLIFAKTETELYTFLAGLLFNVWIWLIVFIKPTYDEVHSDVLGFEDVRDVKEEE